MTCQGGRERLEKRKGEQRSDIARSIAPASARHFFGWTVDPALKRETMKLKGAVMFTAG
jgi:hypothetical protein